VKSLVPKLIDPWKSMEVKIEKLKVGDIDKFTGLIRVFEDVFEMKNFSMPERTYLQKLLESEGFFVFVATLENTVIGGLTAYIMHQYYSKSPLVYVFDLAVKTQLQRKGIGKMLIEANNKYCKSMGAEVVMVQADEVDDYAIKFYRSTGARGERVVHFDYQLTDKLIQENLGGPHINSGEQP
jgi:ribosomal protein S18 acetylase RimI-like enzyme